MTSPALTPEEWADLPKKRLATSLAWANAGSNAGKVDFCGTPDCFDFMSGHGEYSDSLTVRTDRRHALAALALHEQSFGFTYDDVAFLHVEAKFHRDRSDIFIPLAEKLEALASRIAALLPPTP